MDGPPPTPLSTKVLKWAGLYFLIPVVVAATPAVLHSGPQWWSHLTNSMSWSVASEEQEPIATAASGPPGRLSPPGAKPIRLDAASASVDKLPLRGLAEVLRFDIAPNWIMDQWPRVSAGLGELQLQGYRVPLVSGTDLDDVAGALTYYFNSRQQVQRITFFGVTGDPRKLAVLAVERFHFARRLTNDPSIFLYEVAGPNRKPRSTLWIRPARVVKATDANARFEIAMSIERPEE